MAFFLNALAQNEDETLTFDDLIVNDTLTTLAEPVGGYTMLLQFIEKTINEGDTVGKKYPRHLYNVRFRVNSLGAVDSTYIGVNHSACPLHRKIASIIMHQTKWVAAKERGKPINSHVELIGRVYFTKHVLKKYRCW